MTQIIAMQTGSLSVTGGFRQFNGVAICLKSLLGKTKEGAIAAANHILDTECDTDGDIVNERVANSIANFHTLEGMSKGMKTNTPALINNLGGGIVSRTVADAETEILVKYMITYRDVVPGITDLTQNKEEFFLHFTENAPLRLLRMKNIKSPHVASPRIEMVEGRYHFVTEEYAKRVPQVAAALGLLFSKDVRHLPKQISKLFEESVLEQAKQGKNAPRVAEETVVVTKQTDDTPQKVKTASTVRFGGSIVIRKRPK